MKIALLTSGSRGDVQPFVALARGLRDAGHQVTLAAPSDAGAAIREQGVTFASLGVDLRAMAESAEMRRAMSGSPAAVLRAVRDAQSHVRTLLFRSGEIALAADAVVFHPKTLVGSHVAEATGIPTWVAAPAPLVVPTRAFPVPLGPLTDLGPLNRASYAANRIATLSFHDVLSRWRAEALGLAPLGRLADPFTAGGRPLPVLYAFSRAVVPRPDDWPERVHVTGYWFLDDGAGADPPPDLARFVAEGDPPVCIGFGSLAGTDPARTTATVLEAVRRAGVRAVLLTGWGGLKPADVPPDVHVAESAPHPWLFARCAAVVHHGGAGSTAAGLRAGRPTVVCPFFGDQSFWGARVHDLGVGPEPIPQRRLSTERLADALLAATRDPGIRSRAEALGAALRRENGVEAAVSIIEGAAASRRR